MEISFILRKARCYFIVVSCPRCQLIVSVSGRAVDYSDSYFEGLRRNYVEKKMLKNLFVGCQVYSHSILYRTNKFSGIFSVHALAVLRV